MRARPSILLQSLGTLLACCGVVGAEEDLGILTPMVGPIRSTAPDTGLSVDREFPASVSDSSASVGKTTTRANARVQAYHQADQEWTAGLSVAQADLQGGAVFPETGPLPDRLDDIRLTIGARWRIPSGAVWGVSASAGSASDHPFQGVGSLTESVTAYTYRPQPGGDAWLFLLSYSDDRAVLDYVPVPGFAYLHHDRDLFLMAGFPISAVRWTPQPAWRTEAFVTGFGAASLTQTWMPLERDRAWRLHVGGSYGGEVYRRSEDPDRANRIIFQELRWTAGSGFQWTPQRRIDLYGGWAMLRRISEGHSFLHTDNVIRVRPGWVAGATAAWRW